MRRMAINIYRPRALLVLFAAAVVAAGLLALVETKAAWGLYNLGYMFGDAQNLPVGEGPVSITSADFDGDGKKDVAVANSGNYPFLDREEIPGGISVLLGDGHGALQPKRDFEIATNLHPQSVTSALFNDDFADLAVANEGSNDYNFEKFPDDVSVLMNNSVPVPPETSIDSGPTGTIASRWASFSFSSSEANPSFECSLDGGGWAECTSPTSYNDLADGKHTFEVRAIGAAGNWDDTPASQSWTVDTTAPYTTISSGPSGTTNSKAAEFVFESSEQGSTFECSTDATNYRSCISPKSYTDLAEGSYTFYVRATDAAGNTGAAASQSWTVDLQTPPVAKAPTQSFGPRLETSKVPVKLAWSASDADGDNIARYELQQSTNGSANYTNVSLPSATSTSITLSLTPANTYQFKVRAQDTNGNWSEWAQGPSFKVESYQENSSTGVSYPSGTWTRTSLSGAYGGYVKYAKTQGATARFSFEGRNVAWVATMKSDRGKADVYVDGAYEKTVDLYSSSTQTRQVVLEKSWESSGSHILEVRLQGSSGRPYGDIDAFVALH